MIIRNDSPTSRASLYRTRRFSCNAMFRPNVSLHAKRTESGGREMQILFGDHRDQQGSSSQQVTNSTNSSSAPIASPAANSALTSCVYIALRCSQCGELRQALSCLPVSETVLCPECGTPCSFVSLGAGLTSRPLPFYEIQSSEGLVSSVTGRTNASASAFRPRLPG